MVKKIVFVSFQDISGRSGQNVYAKEIASAFGRNKNVNLFLILPRPILNTIEELGINAKKIIFFT